MHFEVTALCGNNLTEMEPGLSEKAGKASIQKPSAKEPTAAAVGPTSTPGHIFIYLYSWLHGFTKHATNPVGLVISWIYQWPTPHGEIAGPIMGI